MKGFSNYEAEMEKFRTSKLHELYPEFIDYLHSRPVHIKSKELEMKFSINGAEVRQLIQFARRMSIPISSSGQGYRYAKNSEELETTLQHLKERRDSLSFTISQLEKIDVVDIGSGDTGVSMEDFYESMR